jgi:hypothetical protein
MNMKRFSASTRLKPSLTQQQQQQQQRKQRQEQWVY